MAMRIGKKASHLNIFLASFLPFLCWVIFWWKRSKHTPWSIAYLSMSRFFTHLKNNNSYVSCVPRPKASWLIGFPPRFNTIIRVLKATSLSDMVPWICPLTWIWSSLNAFMVWCSTCPHFKWKKRKKKKNCQLSYYV